MNNVQTLFNQAGDYLQQTLGESLLPEDAWAGLVKLPRYIAQTYDIVMAKLAGNEVVLMAGKGGTQALSILLKHRALIQKGAGVPVIWVAESIQAYARKEMVAQRVPFIISFKQIYLPMLGVQFQERALAARVDTKDKLQVATQVFLMNTALQNLPETLNAKKLALFLGYSLMTMTRMKSELVEHGWLDMEVYIKEKLWRLTIERGELWKTVKPFLQNPVRKRLWIRNPNQYIKELPLTGLSALAEQTMLGEPLHVVRAIGELDWRQLEKELDADQVVPEAIDGALELEIWRYAPNRIKALNTKKGDAGNDVVDPYSLFLGLENMDDDRVQLALKELMKGMNNGSSIGA